MGVIVVHVQPRAKGTEVVGRLGDAIKIRLAAPPVDGAANDELIRFIAEVLGVRRQAVSIKSGASARSKRVAIAGVDQATAEQRLLGESPSQAGKRSLR